MKSPTPQDFEALEEVRLNNPTVHRMMNQGAPLEQIIVALAFDLHIQQTYCRELEAIAPRKFRDADGTVFVYRCPEELLPETRL